MRIAESLAKMKLQAVAGEEEVDEALRLFQVSTLDAALSGSLSGVCCCCCGEGVTDAIMSFVLTYKVNSMAFDFVHDKVNINDSAHRVQDPRVRSYERDHRLGLIL